ncbi:unnamed protein product [Sphagnum troendelagicum]
MGRTGRGGELDGCIMHRVPTNINSLHPSVCDGVRVRHRRPTGLGPARPGTPGLSDLHRSSPPCGVPGRVGHRRPASSLVPCTGGTGTAVLWFPARADRGLEEERCAAAGERRGGGGQRREEKKRREEKSVAWRRSDALLQAREEEEEDRGEKRRKEKKRAWPGGGALRCCRR